MIVMSLLTTDKQRGTMIDWISKHYKENPTEDEVIEIARSNQRDDSITETFTTPEGEVYGFVDKEGNIYLDETVISPEHPIHEYTHLWDRVVAEKNPALWRFFWGRF